VRAKKAAKNAKARKAESLSLDDRLTNEINEHVSELEKETDPEKRKDLNNLIRRKYDALGRMGAQNSIRRRDGDRLTEGVQSRDERATGQDASRNDSRNRQTVEAFNALPKSEPTYEKFHAQFLQGQMAVKEGQLRRAKLAAEQQNETN